MAILKTFNNETNTWESISTTNASGIYTTNETLRNDRGYNVETILSSLNEDVNMMKRNITWLAKYGGGGSGSGGGTMTQDGKILLTDGNMSAYNDDATRQMTLSENGLTIKVEHPIKSYLFQITVQFMGQTVKRAVNVKELHITEKELKDFGITSSGELTVTAYHQASLTTITWLGRLIVAKVNVQGMETYNVSYDNLTGYKILLNVYLSISGSYFYEVSGSSIRTQVEGGTTVKVPVSWGPIIMSAGDTYHASEIVPVQIAVDFDKLVDDSGASLIMPGNNTLKVKFIQNDNNNIYGEYTFNVILETSDPTFICSLSEDPTNRTQFSLYTTNVSIDMPFKIIYAGQGTFIYRILIDNDESTAWLNNFCSWGKEVPAVVTIYNAKVKDYNLTLQIQDNATNQIYQNTYYVTVSKPASSFLPNTHDTNCLFDFWGQGSSISNSGWNDVEHNKTINLYNTNPKSQNITEYYGGRGLRLQNACYGIIDTSSFINYFTGQTVQFSLSLTYRTDYHPDDERIILQWADLQGDVNPGENTIQKPGVPTKGICIKAHSLYVLGTKIITLVDKEIVNLCITFSSSATSTKGNVLIYIDGVIEATLRDIEITSIIPETNRNIIIGAGYYANTNYQDEYKDFTDCVIYRLKLYNSCLSPFDVVTDYLNTYAACNLTTSGNPNTALITEGLTRNFIEVDDNGNITGSKLYSLTGGGGPEQFDNTGVDLSKHFSVDNFITEANGQVTINNNVSSFSIPIPIVLIDVSTNSFWSWENFLMPAGDGSLPQVPTAKFIYYDQKYDSGINDNANFKIINCTVEPQGTSTKADPVKNLQVTFNDAEIFSPRPDWFPEKSYTLKADIVDSSHSLNTSIGKFVNTELGFDNNLNAPYQYSSSVTSKFSSYRKTDTGKMFSEAKVKHGVEGFPVFVIIKFAPASAGAQGALKSLGIYQFILGRNSPRNLGYEFITSIKDSNGAPVKINAETDYPLYLQNVSTTTEDIKGYWLEFGMNQSMDNSIQFSNLTSSNIKPDSIKLTGPFWQSSKGFYDTYLEIKYSNLGAEAKNSPMEIDAFEKFVTNVQSLPFKFRCSSEVGQQTLSNVSSEANPVFWDKYDYTATIKEDGTPGDGKWEKTSGTCSTVAAGDGLAEILNNLNLTSYAYYFVIMMFFGLVDNFMKNMPIKLYRTESKDENGNYIWENPLIGIYDTDTGAGQDNQGGQTITEDMWLLGITNAHNRFTECPADKATNSTVAGSSNKLWYFDNYPILYSLGKERTGSLYADAWYTFLKDIADRHSDAPSLTTTDILQYVVDLYYDKYFMPQTDGCGELLFNLTYISKYLTDYNATSGEASSGFADITKKLHGRRKYQVKSWLSKRVKFLNSMFNALGTTSGMGVTIPIDVASVTMALSDTIEMKTNSNILIRTTHQGQSGTTSFTYFKQNEIVPVFWGNTNDGTATDDYNLKHEVTNPNTILEFGDLIKNPEYPLYYKGFSSIDQGPFAALTTYNVSAPEKSENSLSKLAPFAANYMSNTFKANSSAESELRVIDFRNTNAASQGTFSLDISSGFGKLQELYLSNSCIDMVSFPNDVSLKSLDIKQSNITNLSLNQQNFITTIDVNGCAILSSIEITNCAKLSGLTLNSTNSSLRTINLAGNPEITQITCEKCPQLTTITITGCPKLNTLTIKNCNNLKTVNIESTTTLKTITITNCTKAEQLNITGSDYSGITTININGSTFTGITYGVDSKTFSQYTSEQKILDVSKLTSLKTFNTEQNTEVEYVRFANVSGKPFVLSHTFQNCTKLKRVFGNIKLTKKAVSGNYGIFRNCSNFSIHGIINTTTKELFAETASAIKYKDVSVYRNFANLVGTYSSDIKACINSPFNIINSTVAEWNGITLSKMFQSGNSVTNFEIDSAGGNDVLNSMFYGTSISTFDVYYMLNVIATYRNTIKDIRLINTFFNTIYPIFDWSIDNNPYRFMFAYCTNITYIQYGFKTANAIYIPGWVSDSYPSMLNGIPNCTYIYQLFNGGNMVSTRNVFKFSSSISNGYVKTGKLETIYFLYLQGIVESETADYLKYDNVKNFTGSAYIKYLGNCTGMFDSVPNLSTIYSVVSTALALDFSTVSFPVSIKNIYHSFNANYSKGNLNTQTLFPTGCLVTNIGNSLNSSNYNANYGQQKSIFFIYDGMFSNMSYITSIGYPYTNNTTINTNFTYTNSSFSGNGITKRIVDSPETNTLVSEFPYNLFSPISSRIESLCSFFENCENTFNETPKLPGDLFKGCSKLKAVPKLFKNVNFTYELTGSGFKDCNYLHNIYQIFYQTLTVNETPGITGMIPYKLFYHGHTTATGTYNNYVFMKFEQFTATLDNIVQLKQTNGSWPEIVESRITYDIDDAGNMIYYFDNTRIYLDNTGLAWYDNTMMYNSVTYKDGTKNVLIDTPAKMISNKLYNTTTNTALPDAAGIRHDQDIETLEWTYGSPYTNIVYAQELFVGNLMITPYIKDDDDTFAADLLKNPKYRKSRSNGFNYYKAKTSSSFTVLPEDTDMYMAQYLSYWVYDGDCDTYDNDLKLSTNLFLDNKKITAVSGQSFDLVSDGAKNDSINYICSPDLLRYCKNSSTTSIYGIFKDCGYNISNSTSSSGIMGTGYNYFSNGIYGRICPYMFRHLTSVTNFSQMFKNCRKLSSYNYNGKIYQIPNELFTSLTKATDLYEMFAGLAFYTNTELNVFSGLSTTAALDIRNIFAHSIFGSNSNTGYKITGVFTNYNIGYASGAFSGYLMNIDASKANNSAYKDTGFVSINNLTNSFKTANVIFENNFNKVQNASTYYLYAGYNNGSKFNESKVTLTNNNNILNS